MRSDEKAGKPLLAPPDALSDEERLLVERALDDMVNSVPFRTSRQCQDLLRYVVLQSLAGEEESLRERVIGVEVFGRRPDYDQAADPVVRIRAADVRKRIALYYEAADRAAYPVKIAIHSGSYRAFSSNSLALAEKDYRNLGNLPTRQLGRVIQPAQGRRRATRAKRRRQPEHGFTGIGSCF